MGNIIRNIIGGLIIILIITLISATAIGISLMFDQKANTAMGSSYNNVITTPQQVITTPQQTSPLATVIGKSFVVNNIRSSGEPLNSVTIEYSFSSRLYIVSYNGKQTSSDVVKISERRLQDGLSVNLTDFAQADYPYWAEMTFYDTGNFAFQDRDGDVIFGEWSTK